jgi:hypothetical protein
VAQTIPSVVPLLAINRSIIICRRIDYSDSEVGGARE